MFTLDKPLANPDGTTLTFLLTQNAGGWNSDDNQNHNLGRFRLSLTTTPGAEADPVPAAVRQILSLPRDKRTPDQDDVVFGYWRTTVAEWAEANKRIEDLWKQYPEGTTQLVLAARDQPRDTHVLKRGNFLKPGVHVDPGVPAFLNPLPADAPPNRLTLARWLVDRQAPTTARSVVNRVWQMDFGNGIVATSEDLGLQSEPPSHPELLDWLAVEFMDRGWSLKKLQRLIVTERDVPPVVADDARVARARPRTTGCWPAGRASAWRPRRCATWRWRPAACSTRRSAARPSIRRCRTSCSSRPPAMDRRSGLWKKERIATAVRSIFSASARCRIPCCKPSMRPNGDFACVRRGRSDTPLQALMTLNEPEFLECARALALRR